MCSLRSTATSRAANDHEMGGPLDGRQRLAGPTEQLVGAAAPLYGWRQRLGRAAAARGWRAKRATAESRRRSPSQAHLPPLSRSLRRAVRGPGGEGTGAAVKIDRAGGRIGPCRPQSPQSLRPSGCRVRASMRARRPRTAAARWSLQDRQAGERHRPPERDGERHQTAEGMSDQVRWRARRITPRGLRPQAPSRRRRRSAVPPCHHSPEDGW